MADLSTLARPYAKAAFDYANENGVVNEWENFLFIAATVVNDKSFSTWLDNPAVSAEHKSAALVDLYDSQVAGDSDSAFKQLLGESKGSRYGNSIATLKYHPSSIILLSSWRNKSVWRCFLKFMSIIAVTRQ